ncbi:MAG TPA: glycoside hydrolase family 28 protein [Verrucomicrobiae bacterium]|jgi:polygalacturonase|nr:glycoside hydrolase family 28 protein [Verrucomicrobiae bacterium]
MKTLFAAIVIVSLVSGASARVFNVLDYGAKTDGTTLDTTPIQKALDECGESGGGTVEFPAGVYLSQPIVLRGETTFKLDSGATLLAVTNQSDFMKTPGDWLKARSSGDFVPFITGKHLKNITFTGRGTIDGNGYVWWGEAEKARQRVPGYSLPRPNLLILQQCKNVVIENVTLQNSPKSQFVPDECEGVVVSNVTILAPEHAANTDGIDPSDSRNVLITRCHIDTGDDDIAIKSGHKAPDHEFACENISVSDCLFLHGHGMSIGSETYGGVRNVTVTNCVFNGTENGLRIKSQRGKGGLVENIVFEDIHMTNVDPALTFTCYYMANSAKDPVQKAPPESDAAQAMTEKTPIFRDIYIKNVTANCPRDAGIIMGLPESGISNVVFENVNILAATGMKIENAKGIQFKNSKVRPDEDKPFIVKNAEVENQN